MFGFCLFFFFWYICNCFLKNDGKFEQQSSQEKKQVRERDKETREVNRNDGQVPYGCHKISNTVEVKLGETREGSLLRCEEKRAWRVTTKRKFNVKGSWERHSYWHITGCSAKISPGSKETWSQDTLETARIGQQRSSCSFKWNFTMYACSV